MTDATTQPRALFEAIAQRDLSRVAQMLVVDPTLANALHPADRWSSLQWAIMHGCNARSQQTRPIVDLLIERGANVGLAEAAMLNDTGRLQVLIGDGTRAKLDAADARGWTALHWAAEMGAANAAQLLVAAGANVDAPADDGPPLERAAHPGPNKPNASSEVIALLRANGAKVDVHMAATLGDSARLADLLDADSSLVNARDGRGATPLYQCAHNLHISCVDLLLQRGADVNVKLLDGQTPISAAVDHMWDRNGPEVVARLLQASPVMDFFTAAQANVPDVVRRELDRDPGLVNAQKWGHTVLYLSAGAGAADVVRVLAERGADLEWKREHDGHNSLHNAIWAGRPGVARVLLSCGANPNARDKFGETPLHNAILRGRTEIAAMLIERGANLSIRDDNGITPLELARKLKDRDAIIEMIVARA